MSTVPEEAGSNPMDDNGPIPPREQLVKTAAKFLSSRNVVNSAQDSKIAFLKKKGLSDTEIDLAMKQADVIIQSRNFQTNQFQAAGPVVQQCPSYWQQQPTWMRYRDIANSVALIGGFAYVAYWFYKKYLGPFLFGGSTKNLDSRLSDLDKMITESLSDLKSSVSRVRDMESVAERRIELLSRQIEDLKSEVSSLKKLMLSRKQFPTATVPGPLTIPPWQLSAAAEEKEVEEEGGGSGTNGSDSSLEMIKE